MTKPQKQLISIGMPLYNVAGVLCSFHEALLCSIWRATDDNFEVI